MGRAEHGKRRSKGQRIGELGESIFEVWAKKRELIPNKLPQDYGIDFMCWQSQDVGLQYGVHMVGPAQLAVQVKAVKGKTRKRIKLNKADAGVILGCRSPFCFVAVDVKAEEVHYRFRDISFVDELIEFLASADSTRTWNISDLESSTERFQADLAQATHSGSLRRVQVHIAERTIGLDLPGARLSLGQTSGGGMAMCELPWYGSAFKVEESAWESVRQLVFDQGQPPHLGMDGLQLHPSLHPALDLADSFFAVGGTADDEVVVTIYLEDEQEDLVFKLRRVDDERAYVHDVGIGLVLSDARRRDGVFVKKLGQRLNGVHVHELDLRIHRQEGHPLGAHPEAVRFFKLMSPGATLFGKGGMGVPVEHFQGDNDLGRALKAIESVSDQLGSSLDDVYLQDLEDNGFVGALGFLEALMVDKVEAHRLVPGVVFEEAIEGDDWPPTRRQKLRLPIVGNFGSRGFVVWLDGTIELYLHDGHAICGFRPVHLTTGVVELRGERIPEVDGPPEVWFYPEWPGHPVASTEDNRLAMQKKTNLPFGAWFVEDGD